MRFSLLMALGVSSVAAIHQEPSVAGGPILPVIVHHETRMEQTVNKVFNEDGDSIPVDPAPFLQELGTAPSAGVPEIEPFEGFKVDSSLLLDPADVNPSAYDKAIKANQKQIAEQEEWLQMANKVAAHIKDQLVVEMRKRRDNQSRLSKIQLLYDQSVLHIKMQKLSKMLNDSNLLLRLLKAQVSVMPTESAGRYIDQMHTIEDRIKRIYAALYATGPGDLGHIVSSVNVVSTVRDAKAIGHSEETLDQAAIDLKTNGPVNAAFHSQAHNDLIASAESEYILASQAAEKMLKESEHIV